MSNLKAAESTQASTQAYWTICIKGPCSSQRLMNAMTSTLLLCSQFGANPIISVAKWILRMFIVEGPWISRTAG